MRNMVGLLLLGAVALGANAQDSFGFRSGDVVLDGAGRTGLTAISHPIYEHVSAAKLTPRTPVVGITIDGISRAFPLEILVWHGVVNARIGGTPIAVSYCPLSESILCFDRRSGGLARQFAVSGKLWNSNLLLHDRQPLVGESSLWTQAGLRAVDGPAAKASLELKPLPFVLMAWETWVAEHPETHVLAKPKLSKQPYGTFPFPEYLSKGDLLFPVKHVPGADRFLPKESMLLIYTEGGTIAYIVRQLLERSKMGSSVIVDNKRGIRITHLSGGASFKVETLKGEPVATGFMFWFALHSIMPEVAVHEFQNAALRGKRNPTGFR